MNRNDFIRILNNTGTVDRQMLGEVRELIDLFPYFQSAHLLLLKGLHNMADVKFESQLKQSAIYVADREVLYYLLKEEKGQKTEAGSDTVIVAGRLSQVAYTNNEIEDQQTVIESGRNSEELINEIERSDPQSEHEVNQGLPSTGMPRSLLVSEEPEEDDSATVIFLLDDDAGEEAERVFYMDPGIIVDLKDDLLELDIQEADEHEEKQGREDSPGTKSEEKSSRKQIQADLIDKFIISNPRIEPVRDRSDHPQEDISKPYTEERGAFITETLAKIYIGQGYYSKAIDIYEKLSLKFPEKSSYFATQIEKVKELIK
jgi:hypothetical protein